ncbi:hypothetical protein RRG08_045603 [Elysia crispata]|uniref:Uncharacterized protein n=1 Tax=Elysia crispata TaxID=231223 RepID=A0AAE1AD67_9GAST|nr:hypothetical protein RRG08_045603 [Elysia crispata]
MRPESWAVADRRRDTGALCVTPQAALIAWAEETPTSGWPFNTGLLADRVQNCDSVCLEKPQAGQRARPGGS